MAKTWWSWIWRLFLIREIFGRDVIDLNRQLSIYTGGNIAPKVIKYQTEEGLTNQLMSFVQGIRIAQSLNCSLVLPSKFKTAPIMSSSSVGFNNSGYDVDFGEVFHILKLQSRFAAKFQIQLLEESDIYEHRTHFFHQVPRYTPINRTIAELQSYLHIDNVILDVGPLYLRMVDTNCSNQREISDILHTLLDCLSDPLNEAISSLLSSLDGNFNAIHFPVELDRPNNQHWEKHLISQKFSPSTPLYVACEDCKLNLAFKKVITKQKHLQHLPSYLKKFFRKYLDRREIMALIDLKILIHAKKFAGSSRSAFSHVVVSERLLTERSRINFCLVKGASFTDDSQTSFGQITPDITCSHLKKIESTIQSSIIREIIRGIPALFEMMNVENSAFNSLIYMLSYQPSSYSLPLVYTFLDVPYGDQWKLYNKVQVMFDKPGKRNLIMCALERALGAPISRPIRLLMVLHNTQIQGAPLMAFYLAKMYQEKLGIDVNFFAPTEYRGKLEFLIRKQGMKIQVGKRLTSVNMMKYNGVYLNTIVSWYHEYFPKYLGLYRKMCILYVHESMRKEIFELYPSAEEVLNTAKALIFVTSRSQSVYQDLIDQRSNGNNFVVGNSLAPGLILDSQTSSEVNGIRNQLGLKPSDLLYVISGDVYPNRNQAVFVEAALLLEEYLFNQSTSAQTHYYSPTQVYFLIVGFTELTQYVKDIYQRVQESPFHNQFILKDKVTHQQALEYMAAADIYVSLALKESFGLALLEAMTMGIPIIVAKLDGVPDVIYREALDVDPTSPQSVYEAMRVMLSPPTRTLHSSYSQARSQYFKQQFFLIRHLDVLRRVLWLPNA